MYTRTFEATHGGEVTLNLYGHDSHIEVEARADCLRARVEVYTEASSGPSVELIEALPAPDGDSLRIHLPKGSGGGMTVVSGGSVVFGSNSIQVNGGDFTSSMVGVSGDASMIVSGQRIEVRGGRTFVNGKEVTETDEGGKPVEPATPIHFRAVVPYGSRVRAETYNSNVVVTDVASVHLKSYNGNLRATGVAEESKLKTYNGDITVGAQRGLRPEVRAETYNGDITALDDDIRLRPKTYNGDVRYPR
jgi:hypothetical protein